MARVIVVGSINQDITVIADRYLPGEYLSGSSSPTAWEGANQAVPPRTSEQRRLFVGAVGD